MAYNDATHGDKTATVRECRSMAALLMERDGSGEGGSNVAVPNEGSGVVQINGTPKAVVNFATDTEFEEMLRDAGLDV